MEGWRSVAATLAPSASCSLPGGLSKSGRPPLGGVPLGKVPDALRGPPSAAVSASCFITSVLRPPSSTQPANASPAYASHPPKQLGSDRVRLGARRPDSPTCAYPRVRR